MTKKVRMSYTYELINVKISKTPIKSNRITQILCQLYKDIYKETVFGLYKGISVSECRLVSFTLKTIQIEGILSRILTVNSCDKYGKIQ